MKVKIYVNWEDRCVISSTEKLEELKKFYIEDAEEDKDKYAEEYLEDAHLSLSEILYATESQKLEWTMGIDKFIKDLAMDNFNEDYEEIEVEI